MKHHPAADDGGPASDLTLKVSFETEGPAEFQIDAAYAWGEDREGWVGTARLVNAVIGGQARSREWLADAFGEDAVIIWEALALEAWEDKHQ